MTWLPRGSPSRACIDAIVDLVTTMASRIKPDCTPRIIRDQALSADNADGVCVDVDTEDAAMRLLSKMR